MLLPTSDKPAVDTTWLADDPKRYYPMSIAQERRLVEMQRLQEQDDSAFITYGRKELHWMERLQRRGLIYVDYGVPEYTAWRLTSAGQHVVFNQPDYELPF